MTVADLPSSWSWATLDDVLAPLESGGKLQMGWSPQCESQPALGDEDWGVLKTTAIQPGEFLPAHNKRLPDHLVPRPAIEVRTGDLLLTNAGPRARCGIPSLVRTTRPRLMMSGKMYRFRPDPNVMDARFLEYFLLSSGAQAHIDAMKTGISDSGLNLTQGRFRALPVPVPPLEEQRRIVDSLEDHLSRLDAAVQLISKSVSSMSKLEQLLVENAVAGSGPKRRLDELAGSSGYGTSEKCVQDGPGVAVVRIPNLLSGAIDLSDEKRVQDPRADISRLMLTPGDLLVVRTNGSRDLIGRTAVVQEGVEAAFASYLIRFQLDRTLVHPEWVQAVLSAPTGRRTLESLAASSAGQYNLSLSKLGGVLLPVPSLADQAALLATLNQSLDGLARSREQSSLLSRRTGVLRRSLLAAAFGGGLKATVAIQNQDEELARV